MTSVVTLRRGPIAPEISEDRRRSTPNEDRRRSRQTENRMRSAHATHLGYPYNLVGYSAVPASFNDYLVNNLGDPYAGSHTHRMCAISSAKPSPGLWTFGSATTGTISGARSSRAEPRATSGRSTWRARPSGRQLLYSREAHYSIPKAARILRMEAVAVDCETVAPSTSRHSRKRSMRSTAVPSSWP